MTSRRRLIVLTAALAIAATAWPGDGAQALDREESSRPPAITAMTRRQQRGIEDSLNWLATHQQPGGAWGDKNATRVADTSLAVLALMAGGSSVHAGRRIRSGSDDRTTSVGEPQLRGEHARAVQEGLRYLARLAWSREKGKVPGYIHDDRESKMHGHGFATLALSTALGNLGARRIEEIEASVRVRGPSQLSFADQVRYGVEKAVRLIERAQDPDSGGWMYDPYPNSHEGSMTITQIQALRAAQDAGVRVNGTVMQRAYDYVRASQNLTDRELYGGFAYQKTQLSRVSYALTGAALTTFFGLGRYGDNKEDRQLIERGMAFLDRKMRDGVSANRQWFYYGAFYGVQAVYQEQDRRRLSRHWPEIRDTVLSLQGANGSFHPTGPDGRSVEYSTAMGALILQVPLETLPIFQRR